MLLFTGVIVLLVGVVGLFVLSGVDTTPDPTTDVEVEVGHDTVNLSHAGGDALAVSEVVVIYGRDVDRSIDLADTEKLAVDDDDRFEGGERRQASHSATGILSVTVVHEPSNTVIAREVLDVPTP